MINIENEEIYDESILPIKYLFEEANESDKLIIVFSGFNVRRPSYNYVRTFENARINKLFILDEYSGRGCYYIGNVEDFNVEKSVFSLISHIMEKYKIKNENVICIGSSKGGTAALYYGIKYKMGYVIAGEPQIRILEYLRYCEDVGLIEYMTNGKWEGEDNIYSKKLDSLIYDVTKGSKKLPKICIHAGSGSYHLKTHILPYINYIYEIGFNVELDVRDYFEHNDLVKFFPSLLTKKVVQLFPDIVDDIYISEIEVIKEKDGFLIIVNAINGTLFAWYVFRNGERVHVEYYKSNNTFFYEFKSKGEYIFDCFVKNESGKVINRRTQKIIIT